jgi:hypothetical protein
LNKLFEPLPTTSSDDSPLPSPSELPAYLAKKRAEFKDSSKKQHPTTPAKVLHSPRIPPSGTPIKQDHDTSSSDSDLDLSDLEEKVKGNDYVQIAHLKPQSAEFTHIFPAFPKSDVNGYAYVIELPKEVLNEKALQDLRDALQYSLTNGGGPRVNDNVKFFAAEGEEVPMKIHHRQCAGTPFS